MRLQVAVCRLKNINIGNTGNMFKETFSSTHQNFGSLNSDFLLFFAHFRQFKEQFVDIYCDINLKRDMSLALREPPCTTMPGAAESMKMWLGQTKETTIKELQGWPSMVTASTRPTPARTLSISGLKSRVLKLQFWLKNDGEKWPRIFYFEIHRAPSELLLPSAKKSAH